MGNLSISRRNFFRSLTIKNEPLSDDPLFDKYARKTLGPRVYKNDFKTFKNDGAESEQSNSLRVGNVLTGLATY